MLRRTKTIVFDDEPDPQSLGDSEPSSARRDLGRPSLRKGPVAVDRDTSFLPQRESTDDEPIANPVHERMNTLRSEFEDSPISRGSQESLAALREEFRRKHVTSDEAPSGGFAFPSFGGLKASRIALVAVALIAGGLAAWLALGRQPEPPPAPVVVEQAAPAPEAPMVEVLVAKAAIPVGTRLTPELLEWQKWPEATIRAEYLTNAAAPEAMTELVGAVARTELLAGEPIRREKLGEAGAGYLSAILEPGKRAVSVAIDARSASGGFVMPNDRVDVVLTAPAPNGLSASRTILENVRVLAIDANLGATTEEAATATPAESRFDAGALATLELDQAQAELIINAANGQLSLVLRPTADTTTPADAERQAINQSIRLTSPFWLDMQQSASSGTAPAYPTGM